MKLNGILPKFQHGFRPAHSTQTAMTQLISIIAKAGEREGNKAVVVASLDLAGYLTLSTTIYSARNCRHAAGYKEVWRHL